MFCCVMGAGGTYLLFEGLVVHLCVGMWVFGYRVGMFDFIIWVMGDLISGDYE